MNKLDIIQGLLMSRDLMLFDPSNGEDLSICQLEEKEQEFVKLCEWSVSYMHGKIDDTFTKEEAMNRLEDILPEWEEASKLNDLNDTTYQSLKYVCEQLKYDLLNDMYWSKFF